MDNRLLAKLARRHGPKIVQQVVNRLASDPLVRDEVLQGPDKVRKPSMGQRIVGGVLLRVATRSVPGAILVGGGLIAKALYDRRHQSPLRR